MKKLLLTFMFIIIIVGLSACDEEIEDREIKSCVLRQEATSETNGAFIVLFASISSKEEIETSYYFYIKGKEGFRLQKINSENVEIVETNEITPQIKGSFYSDGKIIKYYDYIAYVPIGTITQEYKADIALREGAEKDE